MILLIDNYDSFVFNLARYFERLGQATQVVRNDSIDVTEVAGLALSGIVLSPGPCTPDEAGCSLDVVRSLAGRLPILGVCLGHQAIGAAFGGRVIRAAEPMHGRTSSIFHEGKNIFAGLPSPLIGCRTIHWWSIVRACPIAGSDGLDSRWYGDGNCHRQWPVVGVQFHPESILTDTGYDLLAAFSARGRNSACEGRTADRERTGRTDGGR